MADETQVIRGIDWREALPFTHIFRTFRIAIHPSKLILALLALLALYTGGRVLDGIWPAKHRAVPDEIELYERSGVESRTFADVRNAQRERIVSRYANALRTVDTADAPDLATYEGRDRAAREGKYLSELKQAIIRQRQQAAIAAQEAYERISNPTDADREDRDRAIRAVYSESADQWRSAKGISGQGLFLTFFEYQVAQVDNIVNAVLDWRWMEDRGVLPSIGNFFVVGPVWALRHHPVFFAVFALWFLVVWAILGGAICRIAAVHLARDEKISIRQALRFSTGKFLSFFFAPIIPLLIVLVVGLVVALGALITNIPAIGPIIVGLLFFLALAGGLVMTLVLLGTAGGFNMMFPTIAVEGSDSFDAISRSFSYLYARPWRLAFYTLVALVYGALTYLFVRIFVYLVLALTHYFAGMGVFTSTAGRAPLWSSLWPGPQSVERLAYNLDFLSLSVPQDISAFLIAMWVYLTVGLLGAFAISFYFCSNTIIYYLMRQEVDATELDDVYLEQSDEEFIVSEPTAPPAGEPAPPAAPAS